jgi:hypothetical protein
MAAAAPRTRPSSPGAGKPDDGPRTPFLKAMLDARWGDPYGRSTALPPMPLTTLRIRRQTLPAEAMSTIRATKLFGMIAWPVAAEVPRTALR